MDTKSKVLLATVFIMVIISGGLVYYRTMVVHDFPITTESGS